MKKRTLAVAAFAVATFAGCLPKDGGVSTPRAGILVDLLSPDATNTTVILNGNTIGSNISYGSVPQYYNQVTAGQANITITNSALNPLLNSNFSTEPGNFYSVFAVDSASKMKAIIVSDSVDYPNTTDSIKVRFFNFSPNSPLMSVGIKDSTPSLPIWNQRPFETQSFADAHNTFRGLKAGTYTFQVFSPYSASSIKDTTMTFEGKHIYTLFLKGFFADSTGGTAFGLGVVKHG